MKNQIIKGINYLLIIMGLQILIMITTNILITGISTGIILSTLLLTMLFITLRIVIIKAFNDILNNYHQEAVKEGMQKAPFLLRDKFYMRTKLEDKGFTLYQTIDEDIRKIIRNSDYIK